LSIKKSKNTNHTRHLAFQIVAQLPEEVAEAMEVLDYARRLLLYPLDESGAPVPLRIVKKD
jgi:hypothetical protein